MGRNNRWARNGAGLVATGVGLAGTAWLYARYVEPHWLDFTRPTIAVADTYGLSPAWRGFKLAFLSDLHLETKRPPHPALWEAVERVAAEKPHVIALGGDYFTKGKWLPVMADLLKVLVDSGAPVVAVMGNHDYFGRRGDYLRIIEGFEEAGVRMLLNAAYQIEYNGEQGWIAGIDDYAKGEPNLVELCSYLPTGAKPLVLLSHNPDYIEKLPPNFAPVTLSGHTHGGQINFTPPPFHREYNWIRFTQTNHYSDFPLGWYERNGNRLYVGRGLGMSGLQARFNARPEVVMLEVV